MPLRLDDEKFLPQLIRYKRAGVNVVSLNVAFDGVPPDMAFKMLDRFAHWFSERPADYRLVHTIGDLDAAIAQDQLAITFDIEGGAALDGQLSFIEKLFNLGVRWMSIAYNRNNSLGGGCLDDDSGLSPFGHRALMEMERVGMVACCSHTGHRTAMDVLSRATKPVIFSHSNVLSLWSHPRNISDDLIVGCAATGGVVGINGMGLFLGPNSLLTSVVEHIDYVVQLVGVRHVGLGLDYVFDHHELLDYIRLNPTMFPLQAYGSGSERGTTPEDISRISGRLIQRGYSDADVAAVLGGNHRRIAAAVWK